MKRISEYRKPATIYLVPGLRNGNSLRVEFRTVLDTTLGLENLEDSKTTKDILDRLRSLGFSCTVTTSHSNFTHHPNVIDIALDLCTDEKEVIHDLFIYLETVLGKDQVIDRTRSIIKKENRQMKT